jgi:hypothetical protein
MYEIHQGFFMNEEAVPPSLEEEAAPPLSILPPTL